MLSSFTSSKLTIVATSLTLGLIVLASAASADVGWIIQPATSISSTTDIHLRAFDTADVNNMHPDPNSETYVPPIEISSIVQTDVGTSGNPALGKAAVNSLLGTGTGYFKTVSDADPSITFVNSVNFGAGPAKATTADLTIKGSNVGNFYPSQIAQPAPGSASTPSFDGNNQPIYNFGTASPANSAATLWTQSPLSGFNNLTGNDFSQASRDDGRVAVYGIQSLPTSAATIPVTTGHFDSSSVVIVGTVGLSITVALAADPNALEALAPLSAIFTPETVGIGPVTNDLTGAAAQGSFTRSGTGVNTGPDYIMTVPFKKDYVFATNDDGSPKLTVHLNINLASKANLVAGDTNFDGVVDIQDLTLMANKWLLTNAQHLGPGDANGDGVVDIQDLTMAANHWLQNAPALGGGGGGSVTSVPEPGSLVLLGCGAVSALLIARRRVRR